MGAGRLADGLATLCTEHSLSVVDGSTVGALLTGGLALGSLLHGMLVRKGLLLFLRSVFGHSLRPHGALQIV
jgi:hypothetical protein